MSTIYLSEKTNIILKNYLRSKGHRLFEIKGSKAVYEAISSHADIYVCKLNNEAVIAQEQLPFIQDRLSGYDEKYSIGASAIGHDYPLNIKYNAAQIGKNFVHNIKHTDPHLLAMAKKAGLNIIPVKQGYTKCNLTIVDDNSVITSDSGLARTLRLHDVNVLLISQGFVKLSGFSYGFIGGASGKVGNEIIFNGDLSSHPDYRAIESFVYGHGLLIKYFKEYELEDIGSIINIEEV